MKAVISESLVTAFCGNEKIMSEEIRESVKNIEVVYDEIEIAMKVGSGAIVTMQKAIDFLKGMLDYGKSLGKTSMRKYVNGWAD